MWLPWFVSFLFLGFFPPAFSGTHGDRGIFFFPVQLTTIRIGNLTRLIHTLLYVTTIHTYIHTYIHIKRSNSLILIIEQRRQNFPKCTHDYCTLYLEYHAFVINGSKSHCNGPTALPHQDYQRSRGTHRHVGLLRHRSLEDPPYLEPYPARPNQGDNFAAHHTHQPGDEGCFQPAPA